MSENALSAIRTVLDKLHAPVDGPVEFASEVYRRSHGIEMLPLTSAEVATARQALAVLERERKAG